MAILALPPGIVAFLVAFAASVHVAHGVTVVSYAVAAVAAIIAIAGAVYGLRYKTAYEVERATREAVDGRAGVLAHERDDIARKLDEASRALVDAHKTIARLEALPNLERVLELVTHSFDRFVRRQEEMHAENQRDAQTRVGQILDAIDQAKGDR